MRSQQLVWNDHVGWTPRGGDLAEASLVLYFGARERLASGSRYDELRAMFPFAHIVGCSSGGQIDNNNEISDDKIVAAAIGFDATPLRLCRVDISDPRQSRACGEAIGRALLAVDLAGIFVLSDGLNVNGSALVAGITDVIGPTIPLTGGLASDGADFKETLVGGDCAPQTGTVAAIGFYGSAIRIGHGNAGGWDLFGPRRRITKSEGNILFELDGEGALDLYERYLGEEDSKGLPASALLFPLQVQNPAYPDSAVVRTVLAVDHDTRSMTFAGDVPQGWSAQLMRGSFDRLATGAADAARQARACLNVDESCHQLSILVSCIGRRLLMGQRSGGGSKSSFARRSRTANSCCTISRS